MTLRVLRLAALGPLILLAACGANDGFDPSSRRAGIAGDGVISVGPTVSLRGTPIEHVLLLSIDGLHAIDLYNWAVANPRSFIASLRQHGVEYPNALATTPSHGFPAMLALATGGTPKATGVYSDDSYDRTLFSPGSKCQGTPGTEVVYTSAIDEDATHLSSPINPANLPLTLNRRKQCTPVFPHEFLKVNTIFEVVKGSGAQTAWADSHPAFEILDGPSGTGISDLYTPEVNSLVANGGTVNGVALAASLTACDGSTNSIPVTTDYTTCEPAAMAYDDVKVQAVINQMDGFRSDGTVRAPVPALFGMNFEAVAVAQTLQPGGYTGSVALPSALLETALAHVDVSVGRFLSELESMHEISSTLVVLTAKYGQAPIDRTLVRRLPVDRTNTGLTSPLQFVQATVPSVDHLFASFVNPNTGISPAVGGHLQLDGDAGLLWLQTRDETSHNLSAIAGALSQPTNAALVGADQLPEGSVFSRNLTSGAELAAAFGDPQSNDPLAAARAPNVFLQPNIGVVYTSNGDEFAGHGGGSLDDIDVALLLSNPAIGGPLSVFEPVHTTQVAVTILDALQLDPRQLMAVGAEGTEPLPALAF